VGVVDPDRLATLLSASLTLTLLRQFRGRLDLSCAGFGGCPLFLGSLLVDEVRP
jgi:hypothetical protein